MVADNRIVFRTVVGCFFLMGEFKILLKIESLTTSVVIVETDYRFYDTKRVVKILH